MTGTNEFTTERLVMRRYHMDDSLILYEKFGRDPQMYKYSGWNPYASYDMACSTVQKFIESYKRPDFYGWAIEHEGQLIGTIGAYEYDPKRNCIETGVSIERDFWGKGYATEALKCAIGELFRMGCTCVRAGYFSENPARGRVMEKSGMHRTGKTEEITYREKVHVCILCEIHKDACFCS